MRSNYFCAKQPVYSLGIFIKKKVLLSGHLCSRKSTFSLKFWSLFCGVNSLDMTKYKVLKGMHNPARRLQEKLRQWILMESNGSYWILIIQIDPNTSKWIPMYPYRYKWVQIDPNRSEFFLKIIIDPKSFKWIPTDLKGLKLFPMGPHWSQWIPMDPIFKKWILMDPIWSH